MTKPLFTWKLGDRVTRAYELGGETGTLVRIERAPDGEPTAWVLWGDAKFEESAHRFQDLRRALPGELEAAGRDLVAKLVAAKRDEARRRLREAREDLEHVAAGGEALRVLGLSRSPDDGHKVQGRAQRAAVGAYLEAAAAYVDAVGPRERTRPEPEGGGT